jgi:hypothetical protein
VVFQDQDTLSFPTDTLVPSSPVSIFYMHEGQHPFCLKPACICHANDKALEALLRGVIRQDFKLRLHIGGTIRWEVTDGPA